MPKIAFIGAGSLGFGPRLVSDILSYDSLHDSALHLVDLNPDRLAATEAIALRLIADHGLPTRIAATTEREPALDGADYVITALRVATALEELDARIPREVGGLRQTVGDTLGIGGVMKGLRTIPPMLAIARDMERLCPGAPLLNSGNPMAMIHWAISAGTRITSVGLCHGTLSRSRAIAGYLGVDPHRMRYRAAGINHMVWFTELSLDGEDLYPRLRALADDPEIARQDPVAFEMVRHFGHFPAVGTRHCDEYVPYFLPHEQEIARLGLRWADEAWLEERRRAREELEAKLRDEADRPRPIARSDEYTSAILHAMETDTPTAFYGNVPNAGLIPNLLDGCCVEVPCLADGAGLRGCYHGPLPAQLAALCASNVAVQGLVVKAVLENDREAAIQAALIDPNAAATLTLAQIREAMEKLLAAEAEVVPKWR